MKAKISLLFIVFLLCVDISLAQANAKQQKTKKIENQDEFAKLKKKAEECGKGACKAQDSLPKFEKTEGLKAFVKSEHGKMKNKKSLH